MAQLMGMTRRRVLGAAAALILALAGGGPALAQDKASAQDKAPITVFAAASLTDSLQAAGKAYTARAGVPVRFSFASSAVIAHQLESGARADLFISADTAWMDYVQTRGLIQPQSRHDLLRGRLALVAPRASRVRLSIAPRFALAQALGPRGRLAVGDPDYVPAGRYARAALEKLGVWQSVADRLARADNVRVALAFVSRGEAPLGIVYETDARIDPGVRVVGLFPENSHPPIVYPAAVTRNAGAGGRGFHAFLRGAQGQAIFRRYGFRSGGG
ncbi:molybdate ABC transporter substrate-binding protein [uncultured Sphingomonas sp.]|uniref:molybdate ABC transporter substrate-binding protein n=1 Tax=uncultured Sphingomonas sp. TaxID=158754 RepID=UPI000A878069|nr:molybdate ABC transporter substrate-binding protein [uncultured Sphingomonas sp.]